MPDLKSPSSILYSFRRCPYAIRARMAVRVSRQTLELREVVLKDKPEQMLTLSPKATVPVLHLTAKEQVLEESLAIMLWALEQRDPDGWLGEGESTLAESLAWIAANDGEFKHWLDRYKYADRHPGYSEEFYRDKAMDFIHELEQSLSKSTYLLGSKMSLADVAVMPFVRQFAFVDKAWFDAEAPQHVQKWLAEHLQSDLFLSVMDKLPQWHEGDEPYFMN
jgi:glutathione S-transferase